MTRDEKTELRLWPGPVIVALQWLVTFGSGRLAPNTPFHFFSNLGGPAVGLLLVVLWWSLGSRAPRRDRWLGTVLILAFLAAAFALADPTAITAVFLCGIPTACTALVAWAFLCRHWAAPARLGALATILLVACGAWVLVRGDGVDGDIGLLLAWRWQPTAEERLLAAEAELAPVATAPSPAPAAEAAWPGFRGADRRGVVEGFRVATDWQTSPPVELWRRPVGPGWSSFALAGNLLFTQEQRGDEEVVAAYDATTGEPVWRHLDAARFWEALGGAGPRATPSWDAGRLYALGATGILNALDAADGSLLWRRSVAEDTGAPTPEWGFSSSPLVSDGLVVVHAGAPGGKAVVAYDALTGEPRWYAPAGLLSYASLQKTRLAGVDQLLMVAGDGVTSLAPAEGTVLWKHVWPSPSGTARVVQPASAPGGAVLVGTSFGMGTRRLDVARDGDDWRITERWTSRGLKPYYNDLAIHRGHAYGFDGRILVGLDLETGERVWKGGRYGNGQLLLLPEQDLLLVLSDRGDVALVEARPQGFSEVARFSAIEGKTWNHPVLVEGVLYVRNAQEMAAFRMPEE